MLTAVLARVFGTLGFLLTVTSFQMKTRKGILAVQIASNFCFFCQFTTIGAITGAIFNFIGLIRPILYTFKGKNKFFSGPWVPIIIISACVSSLFYTVPREGIIAISPCVGMICTSISMWMTKPLFVRLIAFPSSPAWIIYNVFKHSYEGVLTEVVVIMSIIIGILRHDIDWKKSDLGKKETANVATMTQKTENEIES